MVILTQWAELFELGNGVSDYLEHMLDMWDALEKPELRLNHGAVIYDLRSWLSGSVLLSDMAAMDREIARHDCPDLPRHSGYQGQGVVEPCGTGWRVRRLETK